MKGVKQASFFSKNGLIKNKNIWKEFELLPYQNDIIQLRLDCHYLSSGIWKPMCLELGQKSLYYSRKDVHLGYLSLHFTIMSFKKIEGQIIICFAKNNRFIEIKIHGPDKLIGLLARRCILTSFHEDFHIEKLIANGNKKAMIFQGLRKSNNERVAVKSYSKEHLNQFPHGRRNLKNEIKAIRMLNSQHVIQLYEVYETENSIYLIMELLNGGQLTDRMCLYYPEIGIRQLMYNLIKILNQIHKKHLIIRNISPENILFRSKDNLADFVIIDFGEVQFQETQYQPYRTSGFMAPEIFESQTFNEKCDIYSIGVIFYWLVVSNITQEDLQKTKRIYCNIETKKFKQAPTALQSLIKKMLRVDPKNRYSAEKCLQHRYFEAQIHNVDIFSNKGQSMNTLSNLSMSSEKDLCCDGENKNSNKEQKQIDSGSSIKSLSSQSAKEVNFKGNEKKQPISQSKFSKFCQEMEEFAVNSPQIKQSKIEESLFKMAIKNSYQKEDYSKDDNHGIQKQRQSIKKSNSMNV